MNVTPGHRVTIDTTHAPNGSSWMVEKVTRDQVDIHGSMGTVYVSPAVAISIGRLLISHRSALTPGLTLAVHAIALQVMLSHVGHGLVMYAVLAGFFAHIWSLWPLVDALQARVNIQADLVAMRVRYKMRTGEDA